MKVEMREASIFRLKLVKEETIEYKEALNAKIVSPEVVHRIAIDTLEMHLEPAESFWTITLDTKNKITGLFEVSRGTLNASIVHPRDVFQRAILQNANSIILLHNHPSGNPTASKEDIDITRRLINSGDILGIKILDHIIVGNEDNYISFKAEGLL